METTTTTPPTTTVVEDGLTTDQVEALCRKVLRGIGGVKFYGVMGAHQMMDKVPMVPTGHDIAFVVNTHTKDRGGEHWVAFWLPRYGGMPFMFDSFARTPEEMGHPDWRTWMNGATYLRLTHEEKLPGAKKRRTWQRQKHVVQDDKSSVCGILCAYYLYHVSRHKSFNYKHIIPASACYKWYSDVMSKDK